MVMTQGLQAWDGSGRMLVDIGDYSMRYVGTFQFTVTTGVRQWWVPYAAFRDTGWIAVYLYERSSRYFSIIPGNGGFTLRNLISNQAYSYALTFEVYTYA